MSERLPSYTDGFFLSACEPEDIKQEIGRLEESDPAAAALCKRIYDYRFYTKKEFGKQVLCDRFLAFWVNLQFYDKTIEKSKFRTKLAHKTLKKALENKELMAAVGGDAELARVLYGQLYSAARRYLASCQRDKTYTTLMFGFMALKRPQLIEKMLADYFDAICFAHRCGLLADYPLVVRAAFDAWEQEIPDSADMVWRRIEKTAGADAAEQIRALLSVEF